MTISLGLDIGSNSVGSAWVDDETKNIRVGVGIFPAGVEDSQQGRGAPKNVARRQARSLRRNLARRARRKRALRRQLTEGGLLPTDPGELQRLINLDPWTLRRQALERELTPFEFGRLLLHLNQHRGAVGIETDPDDKDEGKIKEAIDRLRSKIAECGARTYGAFMAQLRHERIQVLTGKPNGTYKAAIRNRRESFEFHADRRLIQEELDVVWSEQERHNGPLASLLTADLKQLLSRESLSRTWRHEGAILGQRRTYWNVGTLGRCDLEPADRCAPIADRWASYFRVIETVNNIRLEERGQATHSLSIKERHNLIAALQREKKGTITVVRRALGINTRDAKGRIFLNIQRDAEREINTDWFYREIVHGVFGADRWVGMSEREREGVNRAILRFDSNNPPDESALREGAGKWWALDSDACNNVIAAWKRRPRLDKRLNLSRRAIQNLLPYMETPDDQGRWPTQIEARQRFADNCASGDQRDRYALGFRRASKAERRYRGKHPDKLLPPPEMSNPVVRKAIYEVRRHVEAYLREFGRRPDRVVIELAREARQTARDSSAQLSNNRKREHIRKKIMEDHQLQSLTTTQQRRAVERVLLCRQQRELCAYSGRTITEKQAARGEGVEVDHLVPYSRSWDDGLNNRVLCYRESNRDKGNRTPGEWLNADAYQPLLSRFRHLETSEIPKDGYFGKRDAKRKWENLTREVKDDQTWRPNQLAATGYAARQVGQYLRQALWPEERPPEAGGSQRVFFTKGQFTAMLRRDWQLFKTPDGEPRDQRDGALGRGAKDRSDHRHHAVDAVVIALTSVPRLQHLASTYREQLEFKACHGDWPPRDPLKPPWADIKDFPRQMLSMIYGERGSSGQSTGLIVSHRPQRRLRGAFHEETLFGPVVSAEGAATEFVIGRKRVAGLKGKHLRMPSEWNALVAQIHSPATNPVERRELRKRVANLEDPSPGKSGIVRDRSLRARIRECVRLAGLDPDAVIPKQMQALAQQGLIRHKSGVPIHSARLLWVINNPVVIARNAWNPAIGRYEADVNPRTARVYRGGSNHHVELRKSPKTGKWEGKLITMFQTARRTRPKKGESPRPLVDREDRDGAQFVMSLTIGETIHMRDWAANSDERMDYFVVVKLDPLPGRQGAKVQLVRYNDARPSKATEHMEEREMKGFSPMQLQGRQAVKVRISAVGSVRELERD